MASSHQWQFAPRFRRKAFGWQSDTPILRIKEALAEIKAIGKQDATLAAEGAVLFLTKLAPAIEQVDSSSGRIGATVSNAIATLVPIIAKADVSTAVRAAWLERLWAAFEEDTMPSIESLGDYWGELCAGRELAEKWAERLASAATALWEHCASTGEFGHFKGTQACLSALYAAGQHDALLALIAKSEYSYKSWSTRRWGARALVDAGKHADAIRYAENTKGQNEPEAAIALFCETVLLDTGFSDEAYARYALAATYATTNLATFKSLVKKYPHQSRETILRDLVASQPGQEGKWFAAAKDAGLFELAIELANRSPSDPRTLTRAARDYAQKAPEFALAAGMTALRGIAAGWGYEITGADVLDAYAALMAPASVLGMGEAAVKADVRSLFAAGGQRGAFVARVLGLKVDH